MSVTFRSATWDNIMRGGLVVTLSCEYFRGSFKLDAREVGIPDAVQHDPGFAALVTLGRKKVSPEWFRNEMGSIESLARRAVRQAGYATPFGRFIPTAAWPGLALLLATYEQRFRSTLDKLIENLAQERASVVSQFRDLFEAAGLEPEQRDALLGQIADRWPSAEALRSQSRWAVVVFRVQPATPADLRAADPAARAESGAADTVSEVFSERLAAEAQKTLDQFAAGFRQSVAAWCARAGKSLSGKQRITAVSAARMRTAIDRLRRIDLLGDLEAQSALEEMLAAIGTVEGAEVDDPSRDSARRSLEKLATIAAAQAPDLTVERFASIAADFQPGAALDSARLDSAIARVAALVSGSVEDPPEAE